MKFQKKHNAGNPEERGLVPLKDMMNRLFNESFLFPNFTESLFSDPFFRTPLATGIKVDLKENEKEFLIRAELPGADPNKIDLNLTETHLEISAEMGGEKEERGKNYLRRECSYGKAQRSFDFSHAPVNVDQSKADFKNGVLEIILPKKNEKTSKGRKIPINS